MQRWTRYGHDRGYVRVNDSQVGYRDLKTGAVHCEQPRHCELVIRATDNLLRTGTVADGGGYVARHAQPADDARTEAVPAAAGKPATAKPVAAQRPTARSGGAAPDRDLATNRAGAAARAQARELRAAAPVRTLLARLAGARTDERDYRIGADAEVEVGRRLASLGPDWRVLHAIPVGNRGSDIDHLLIGPAGVFTVNTKHHPDATIWVRGDTFKVNGLNLHHVRNSRFEATRAATLLSARVQSPVPVTGLIVVVGARGGYTVKEQPTDGQVLISAAAGVEDLLRARPAALESPQLDRIYQAARHLATWQPGKVAWDPRCTG